MALADGLAVATANKMLDLFASASQTLATNVWAQLHTGIPGATGVNAASANTARREVTFAAAAAGSKAANGTLPSWTGWASGTETITSISLWTASTAGTYLGSVDLSADKVVNNTDTLNITAVTLAISTLATT